jgi:hypothetical protein
MTSVRFNDSIVMSSVATATTALATRTGPRGANPTARI